MKLRAFSYAALDRLVVEHGFERAQVEGPQIVYLHPGTDVLIILPGREPGDAVDRAHLAAVRKSLTWNGFISEDEFDALVALERARGEGMLPAPV